MKKDKKTQLIVPGKPAPYKSATDKKLGIKKETKSKK